MVSLQCIVMPPFQKFQQRQRIFIQFPTATWSIDKHQHKTFIYFFKFKQETWNAPWKDLLFISFIFNALATKLTCMLQEASKAEVNSQHFNQWILFSASVMVCILIEFKLQNYDLYIEKQSITCHDHFICKHLIVIENNSHNLGQKC